MFRSARLWFESEWFPIAMSLGISYERFWTMNPRILKVHQRGVAEKTRMEDERAWLYGRYVRAALYDAVGAILLGSGQAPSYPEQPFSHQAEETDEDRINMEIQKAILAEEQWISMSKRAGLPESGMT